MSSVHHNRPRFSIDEAQKLAQELYGLAAAARPLPSDRDQNFHLTTETGEQFVLKIASAAESADVLDLQNQAMRHLAEAEDLPGPRVCPTMNGEWMTAVSGTNGSHHFVRLVTYLAGSVLANVTPQSPHLLHNVGRFLGQMDNALAHFDHPAAHRLLYWDIAHAPTIIRRHVSEIDQPDRQALVERFLGEYETAVFPHLPHLRRQIIHNDANDHNLILSPAPPLPRSPAQIGIIDFGDIVHTLTLAEPAIAAAYLMLDKPDPFAVAAHFLSGYHAAQPLIELEQALFYQFIRIRLCTSVALSAHQKKLEPDNAYLTISEKPAWALLEQMAAIDPEEAADQLRRACFTPPPGQSKAAILQKRQQRLGPSLSVSYQEPLKIVRGLGQFLYDEAGRPYLDCVNNVCHVGHSHPRVVETAFRQMALLNTNTRYLHDTIIHYAERLTATLPDPLNVCFFVNSGSEANDLALRLARTYTGQRDTIVLDGAYHGNLTSLIEISPYKFDGPGGQGAPPHVQKILMPDGYRGPYKGNDRPTGQQYAAHVQQAIDNIQAQNRAVGVFIAEALLSCGGQIVLPDGYLETAYQMVRAAGGVCIADEVQVGFGRVGSHFWGFQTQGVVPDIVTMGKPIGNGHPLAAVVTTAEIAQAFHNGMEYFNTFGGNPVSCAVGLAVLGVIKEEQLQEHALRVGGHLKAGLTGLMAKHTLIGDVRGLGLFLGIELVRDRETLEPAAEEATAVVEQMKGRGILLSTDGPLHNVIKIKPPLVFTTADVDFLTAALDQVLPNADLVP
jgi:4-aminobutyrate aminotransferase-like enzyme/Ser/Thr protein kinase RdoA (MazF antagonist)